MFSFKSILVDQLEKEFGAYHIDGEGDEWEGLKISFRNSLINAVMLILKDLAPDLPLEKIEQKISAIQQPDYKAVETFIDILRNHPPKSTAYRVGSVRGEFRMSIEKARDSLGRMLFEKDQHSAEYQATKLRYGTISREIDELLFFYEIGEVPSSAISVVAEKVRLLNRASLYDVWGYILREFDPERGGSNFSKQRDLLPEGFLDDASEQQLPEKIAIYLTGFKQQIIKHRLAENPDQSAYPADAPSIAQLVALNANTTEQPLPIEVLITNLISRIFFFWEAILFHEGNELASLLGLSAESKIVRGLFIQDEIHELKELTYRRKALLLLGDLKKLCLISEDYLTKIPHLESALIRYKLGLEVGLPKTKELLEDWFNTYDPSEHEREVQKKICRYLLDQGIYSFGKKFGRDEIDLITHQNPNVPYVIEVKIYKKKPTEKDIKKNLSQLQVYMDKEQPGRKGILVIYNFSTLLVSNENTVRWFKDRYWVLPINLGKPASKTRSSLILREGKDAEIIECYTNSSGE